MHVRVRVCVRTRARLVNRPSYKAIWKQMTAWWLWRMFYLFITPPFGLESIGFSLMKCLAFTELVKHSAKPILPFIFITQNLCTLSTQSTLSYDYHSMQRLNFEVVLCNEGRNLFSGRQKITCFLLLLFWTKSAQRLSWGKLPSDLNEQGNQLLSNFNN